MEWMQILALVAGGMMLFAIWPMYKNWRANPTEAQPGDWSTGDLYFGACDAVRLDADLVGPVAATQITYPSARYRPWLTGWAGLPSPQ